MDGLSGPSTGIMKVGDLVKMKYEMWWKMRDLPGKTRATDHTDQCGIVYGIAGRGIKVLMPDNTIKLGLTDHWEVVNSGSAN